MTNQKLEDEHLKSDDLASRSRHNRLRVMQDIRAAAVIEFSRSGLKGTSTQAIAERAGLKKSQLHYYINGKEELYQELLADVINDWSIDFRLQPDAEENPRGIIGDYVFRKLKYSLEKPEMSKIFAREILDDGPHLRAYWPLLRARTQKNVDCINGWIKLGLIVQLDAYQLLMHIWSITQTYADFALQIREIKGKPPGTPFDLDAITRDVTGFILRGCGLSDV